MFTATVISHAVIGEDDRAFVIRAWYRKTERSAGWYWSAESESNAFVLVSRTHTTSAEQARDQAIATLSGITFS